MDDLADLRTRTQTVKRPLFDKRTVFIMLWTLLLAASLGAFYYFSAHKEVELKSEISPKVLRETAGRLRGAGVKSQAADLLATYLLQEELLGEERAKLAFTAASLYLEEGNYERALTFLYLADESNPPGALKGEIAAKIVASLEGLKKLGAARYALKTASNLDSKAAKERGGKLFAKVGDTSITVADIEQALAALPPQMAGKVNTPEQKMAFARAFVAEELLERKALRQKLDEDPEVRRQLVQLTRQLLVQKLLQNELLSRGKIEEDDLKNYYEANKSRFTPKDGAAPAFADIRPKVAEAYMSEKLQKVYGDLLEEALAVEEAEFFPENLAEEIK